MAEEVVQQKNPEEPAQQVIADNSTEQAEPVAEVQTDQQEAVTPAEPTLADLQKNMQDFMGREQGATGPGIWAADCCCSTGYGCEA